MIDPEFTNELLGTFKLKAIVHQSENSPDVGHCKSNVKYNNNTMYTRSDVDTNAYVDFDDTSYVVIYEKDDLVSSNVSTSENEKMSADIDLHIDSLDVIENINKSNLLKELSSQQEKVANAEEKEENWIS